MHGYFSRPHSIARHSKVKEVLAEQPTPPLVFTYANTRSRKNEGIDERTAALAAAAGEVEGKTAKRDPEKKAAVFQTVIPLYHCLALWRTIEFLGSQKFACK
jgi:hypothetical protein